MKDFSPLLVNWSPPNPSVIEFPFLFYLTRPAKYYFENLRRIFKSLIKKYSVMMMEYWPKWQRGCLILKWKIVNIFNRIKTLNWNRVFTTVIIQLGSPDFDHSKNNYRYLEFSFCEKTPFSWIIHLYSECI